MDYSEFLSKRLTQLRIQKGISARDMSLSIGQSPGYINKIESQQNLPSMTGFFYICEYFGITPQEFFSESNSNPQRINELTAKLIKLSDKKLTVVESLIDAMENM